MRSTIIVLATLGLAASWISTAGAMGADAMGRYIKSGYHRNEVWPWPHVCADRVAVREPFAIMVRNGWRHQNLLGPHHFNGTSDQLTTAGELKVQWIMTQAPPAHRQVFIERSIDSTVTAARAATARAYAAQLLNDGQAPQVLETHLVSEGRPASTVDRTNVRFQESLPPPVLPAPTAGIITQ